MKTMKRVFQVVGIIAFVAVIGGTLAGCDHAWADRDWSVLHGGNPADSQNNGGDENSPVGTWYKSDSGGTYCLEFKGSASSGTWALLYKSSSSSSYMPNGSGSYSYSSGYLSLSDLSYSDSSYAGSVTISSSSLSFSNPSYSPFYGLWTHSDPSSSGPGPGPGSSSLVGSWYKSNYPITFHLQFDGAASSGSWEMYYEEPYGYKDTRGYGTYTYNSSTNLLLLTDHSYYGTIYSGMLTVSGDSAYASGFTETVFNGTWTRSSN